MKEGVGGKRAAYVIQFAEFRESLCAFPIGVEADFLFLWIDQDEGIGNFNSSEVVEVAFLLEIVVGVRRIEGAQLAFAVPADFSAQEDQAIGAGAVEVVEAFFVECGR